MLVFPPDWFPSEPYLSLPTLAACLRSAGHEVVQKDVNLEMYDWFFSRDFLEFAQKKVPQQLDRLDKKSFERELNDSEKKLRATLLDCTPHRISELIDKAETAKRIVRSMDFYNVEKLERAIKVFNEVTAAISLVYAPARVCMPPMETDLSYKVYISSELLKAVQDTQVNIYRDVFEHILRPAIVAESPNIIGISIAFKQQLFSSMTFCALIKEQFPHIHVTIGGNTVTRLQDVLQKKPKLFALFDSVVMFEGETPFLKLIEALKNGGNLSEIPNLLYRDGSGIHKSKFTSAENMSELPPPDFDGLPLEKYFVPSPILPYLATRGCYWGRCKFCDHGAGYTAGFRTKKIKQIIDDIQYLRDRHGVRYFHFTDESYPASLFKKLSRELIEAKMSISWQTHIRFEKSLLHEEIFKDAARAGCKSLHMGFEAGSEKVLKLMDKSETTEVMKESLKLSSNAGIWNHVMGFFGFPGETYEDARFSMKFLDENRDHIHSIGFGTFDLSKHTPVAKNPKKYGIKIYKNPDWDLALDYYYRVKNGLGIEEAEQVLGEFERNHNPGWDLRIFVREYLFLYVAYFGTNKLPALQFRSGDEFMSPDVAKVSSEKD